MDCRANGWFFSTWTESIKVAALYSALNNVGGRKDEDMTDMATLTTSAPALGAGDSVLDATIQERELTQFEQAEEFRAILLGPEFYPGGLARYRASKQDGFDASDPGGDSSNVQQRAASPLLSKPVGDNKERVRSSIAESKLRRLMSILDEYQEQSYLLDPYLEEIVGPPVRALQRCTFDAYSRPQGRAELLQNDNGNSDVQRLAKLLYYYTKVRGFKTILHFFPHAVDDLMPTLALLEHCSSNGAAPSSWEVRYILLLWLSLICMIPFDLSQFDSIDASLSQSSSPKSIVSRIEAVGRHFLSSPGKERDAASSMLCKLFQRKDASSEQFSAFLQWSRHALLPPAQPSTHLVTGILQTLCNVVKVLTPETLGEHLENVRSVLELYSSDDKETTQSSDSGQHVLARPLVDNSVVNRYKSKMACRLALKMLKPRKRSRVLKATRLSDPSKQDILLDAQSLVGDADITQEEEVPEEVEDYLGKLIDALHDKDTIVRYSAAKGIARVCCRLPADFIDQVADEVTALFAVNVADILGKREDLSGVSECTWQGCCFALAELARRGLLHGDDLGDKLAWVEKALRFDVRRGAHSVGVGVRDAACYVLWALARAHDAHSVQPYASSLSRTLVCVALLDRDVSIRRAASAAFQECVGRLNIFPHGIDVIRMTDFYAIGVRRNAFLQCLPQVTEFAEYRTAIISHLIEVTIVHWDTSMRETAARAIALIVGQDVEQLGPTIVTQLSTKCAANKRDTSVLHGCLLSLAEIGAVCAGINSEEMHGIAALSCRSQAFDALASVPNQLAARLPGTHLVLRAACRLIATCATEHGLQSGPAAWVWDGYVDAAMDRQEEECHETAAEAIAAVSRLIDLSPRIDATLKSWKRLNVTQGQSHVRVLGAYDYQSFPSLDGVLLNVLRFLAALCDESSTSRSTNVETRRNAYRSIVDILIHLARRSLELVPAEMMLHLWRIILAGLEDYSTDARGDVGSWIRLACMTGLDRLVQCAVGFAVTGEAGSIASSYLPQGILDCICASLAKQMVEKIDSVRTEARRSFLHVVRSVSKSEATLLSVPGSDIINVLFPPGEDDKLNDPSVLYSKVIGLLDVEVMRSEVIKGVVLGVGSQRETINRSLTCSLIEFIADPSSSYVETDLVRDVVALAVTSIRSNRMFVPCLQTLNVVLEEDVLDESDTTLKHVRRLLDVATRSIDKVKSVPRILAAAQLVTNLLGFASMQLVALERARSFLLHPFPIVRAASAELLYVQAQNRLDEFPNEAEELLLSTTWTQSSVHELEPVVAALMTLLVTACE